ncbi:MAG: tRNA uridine-5-carboxymethylaminomethyl(34) synthesis GTPase MnmE [Xanthobacteraceae bacterium]
MAAAPADADTIFALSSGRPPAAIAVIRISGPQAGPALMALVGKMPTPRRATRVQACDPENRNLIDEGLALWFPAPASATGEDVAELHLHGGRAVVAAVLAALGRRENCRPAEAGEFTRRAFANGKLDLTRVEGLADMIAAETEAQRRQAVRQLRGWLGEQAEQWRSRLIAAAALVEARIDFADEGDVPDDLIPEAQVRLRALRADIAIALADGRRGERLRDGLVVAIAGPPNAGKSSLLNRIARREAAIVSPHAGTTRDVIEVHLGLGGVPLVLLDTAGIRDSGDPVEQEGVKRAQARAAEADLVLWVIDAGAGEGGGEIAAGSVREGLAGTESTWVIRNKIDLAERSSGVADIGAEAQRPFQVSAMTGAGVDALLAALERFAAEHFGNTEPALITRERHRIALEEAVAALDRALAEPAHGREEIVAEELRLAARALARLVGRVDVEDILDVIFRDFCIGK